MIDFGLGDELELVRATARDFADDQLRPDHREHERKRAISDAARGAFVVSNIKVQCKAVAFIKLDTVVPKSTYADFWPLQIGEYADVAIERAGLLANEFGNGYMPVDMSVTEIQAEDIDAGSDQFSDHVL